MELLLSPYVLKRVDNGNVQRGTLVKILDGEFWGVADLCPHTELGDSDWRAEIKNEGLLYKRTLQLAQEDLIARRNKQSLITGKKVLNNFLINDFTNTDLNQKKYFRQTVKLKGDKRVELLADVLNKIVLDLTLRLDFNAKLSPQEFENFLAILTEDTIKKVEYVEDPTVMTAAWKEWNIRIPLASDWQKTEDPAMAKFKICKPVREEIPVDRSHCILTSAMDHPVGVAHGMRFAQKFAHKTSGFMTLDIYEPNPFNKYFVTEGAWLSFSDYALKDFGIGMTEELNKLNWIQVSEAFA